jgi:phosphoribosyl 1,2-cyclic phosphate phosphodiesterase
MSQLDVTFLGTGTSHGIPVIGCSCPVCTSSDPRDTRYRASILLQQAGSTILVDTSPEFRLQALRSALHHLDAVLYTHDHADHFNGIDDLRVFCKDRSLPVYCKEDVAQAIQSRFSYVLNGDDIAGGIPHLDLRILKPYEAVQIGDCKVLPIPILHGKREIFAFRIGSFAYATDCSEVPEQSIEYFGGLDTLVVGALRYWPHPTHYSVFEAVAFARKVGAKRVFLTHLSHGLSHAGLSAELPEGFQVAYDMLHIAVGS